MNYSSAASHVVRSLAALTLIFAVGCGGDKATAPAVNTSATGSWTGTSSGSTLSMVLNDNSGTVTGSGTLSASSSIALTITGNHAGANVSLTMSAPGYEPLNYAGTLNDRTIIGSLNGSGFTNQSLVVTKQ